MGEESEVVSLVEHTCTYMAFDLEQIPCVHAIAAAKQAKINPATLVSSYSSVAAWRKAYEDIIYPVLKSGESSIPNIEGIVCNRPIKKKNEW